MNKNILFYGHFSGWSSYPTVCKTLANWLYDNKPEDASLVLCDLRKESEYSCVRHIDKVDAYSQMCISGQTNDMLPAAAGRVYASYNALLFGFPTWWGLLPAHEKRIGYHVCDVDTIPSEWALEMSGLTQVLAPSTWCLGVFRRHVPKLPGAKVCHGVQLFDYEQQPWKPDRKLRFVHFCSSPALERKGTLQLAEAWVKSGLGKFADLDCYTSFDSSKKETLQTSFSRTVTKTCTLPIEFNRFMRSYDAVICPSRAEGFGMIPLEAAAHGLPVIMTTDTGHSEHYHASSHESLHLHSGEWEACPPGPGRAPTLIIDELVEKLRLLHSNYPVYKEAAMDKAPAVREHWNWDAVLRRGKLLKHLGW
jgi:glycosyltransferase involved in cell wall biosynthesis